MKKNYFACLSVCVFLFIVSCSKGSEENHPDRSESVTLSQSDIEHEVITSQVLTAAEQAQLTPAEVLQSLIDGNKDFAEDNLTVRNNTERVREASIGQYPKAVILSCLDSRVPVEDVFHKGIGDLFVARVAGNIVNEDILGSMEYACKVSGSKLVVVLGHEYCGAIKSAIDDVKLGNITALLEKIQPAVHASKNSFQGEMTSSNPQFVEKVCTENVQYGMEQIRRRSPILREMEEKGEIKIVGGVYDMKTGKVTFFN